MEWAQRFARTFEKVLNNCGVFHSLQCPMNYSIAMPLIFPRNWGLFGNCIYKRLQQWLGSTVIPSRTYPGLYVL
jgi:hypothetical protein